MSCRESWRKLNRFLAGVTAVAEVHIKASLALVTDCKMRILRAIEVGTFNLNEKEKGIRR